MDVEIEKQFFRKVVTFNYSIVHNVYDSTSHSTPHFNPPPLASRCRHSQLLQLQNPAQN